MSFITIKGSKMGLDDDVKAVADNGGTFQSKLADSLMGLISANNERKSEIDSLRADHDTLRKDHDSFQSSAERENDMRRNEIKSLEEKMLKENQVSYHWLFVSKTFETRCLTSRFLTLEIFNTKTFIISKIGSLSPRHLRPDI